MAINDVKYLLAEVNREQLEETLIGLAGAANPYSCDSIPNAETMDDFFRLFPEGNKELCPDYFFAQNRIDRGGRILIGYEFKGQDAKQGSIRFSVSDNGANMPKEHFEEVFAALRGYILSKNLKIIDEGLRKEY